MCTRLVIRGRFVNGQIDVPGELDHIDDAVLVADGSAITSFTTAASVTAQHQHGVRDLQGVVADAVRGTGRARFVLRCCVERRRALLGLVNRCRQRCA